MNEQEWKARQQAKTVEILLRQEQRKLKERAEWCVVWFSQRLEEGRHAEL